MLSSHDAERDFEVRSEGVPDEEEGDVATSKSDGEINKSKKGRSSKRQIPTSDRLTRSVAKKTETTTLMEYAGYPSTGFQKLSQRYASYSCYSIVNIIGV